jgi:hypothetical protein
MAINIDGNGLITLGGTASTQGRVRLSEDTDNGTNYIELTAPASVASDKTITFPDATGTVVISGTTPSLNGITFPATQVASADANTLDDYEEGTWTPVTRGSLEAVTVNAATYTKVGRLVTAFCDIIFPAVPASAGNGGIGGLPFTVGSGGGSGFISSCSSSAGSTIRSLYLGATDTAGIFITFAPASVNNNAVGGVEFEVTFIYIV